jgi:phage protein D
MSFLTRLAKRYDAVVNVKDADLLFMPIGHGTTAKGTKLESIELTRASGDSHRYHIARARELWPKPTRILCNAAMPRFIVRT